MSEEMPPCAWCGEPSVTRVITRPGRITRKTAPVCEAHAQDFEDREIDTERSVMQKKLDSERKRSQWKVRQGWC